ncbi:mucin-2-like isoform X2 [Armigeres subalbatus]|uniref:mucin-2-like isoform X2 n=1 Tax=Armigeres subalbatus TaxID=124917 RepID=UPI002ED137A9
MAKKCSASHCITQSSRCGKIPCAKCMKSFHLKCVGLSANQHKALRDFPGAEWFCPACRNSPVDFEQSSSNQALNLILVRLASILRLVGAQIDVTRSLCRAFTEGPRRSCNCNKTSHSLPTNANSSKNFEDAINNLQFEFTNVFGSFIGDSGDSSGAKRDRTSSTTSSTHPAHRSGKKTKVDVPVSTSVVSNYTVHSVPDNSPSENRIVSADTIDTNAISHCPLTRVSSSAPSASVETNASINAAQTIAPAKPPPTTSSTTNNQSMLATPNATQLATDQCTQTQSGTIPKPQRLMSHLKPTKQSVACQTSAVSSTNHVSKNQSTTPISSNTVDIACKAPAVTNIAAASGNQRPEIPISQTPTIDTRDSDNIKLQNQY